MTAQPIPEPNPPVLGPGDPDYDRWYWELQYFFSVRQKLYDNATLRSKFVAIHNHEVVDVDTDEFALARRMEMKHPGEVFLISPVELTDPVVDIPPMEFR
jgi:hypothetical protein